ncbi:MAG: hypothetical protein H0V56_07215 [Chthoniobacterales bacterium]|nr:hypothetical protein [Chthoniobacterales bacterium]
MKRTLTLSIGMIICASLAYAAEVKIKAVTTSGPKAAPATSFADDTPMIHALFKTTGAQKGDTVRGVWIAEDVGEKAPANTKIGEKTLVLEGDTNNGDFSVNKPDKGWPAGKYRVEIYAGEKLATTAKFTVGATDSEATRSETADETRRSGGIGSRRIKFPANDPTFTMELPAKWTYTTDKDGNLDCNAGDETYSFSVIKLDAVRDNKGLKAALPDLADDIAKAMEIKNFEPGDIETDENGNGVSFTGIAGEGESRGVEFAVSVHAFEPQKGRFYAIATAATKESDAEHEEEYDEITASIMPIED